MVMHWNTVSIAKNMLSKFVIPPFGPSHLPLHSVPLDMQKRPFPAKAQGVGSSSSISSSGAETNSNGMHYKRMQVENNLFLLFMFKHDQKQTINNLSLIYCPSVSECKQALLLA